MPGSHRSSTRQAGGTCKPVCTNASAEAKATASSRPRASDATGLGAGKHRHRQWQSQAVPVPQALLCREWAIYSAGITLLLKKLADYWPLVPYGRSGEGRHRLQKRQESPAGGGRPRPTLVVPRARSAAHEIGTPAAGCAALCAEQRSMLVAMFWSSISEAVARPGPPCRPCAPARRVRGPASSASHGRDAPSRSFHWCPGSRRFACSAAR